MTDASSQDNQCLQRRIAPRPPSALAESERDLLTLLADGATHETASVGWTFLYEPPAASWRPSCKNSVPPAPSRPASWLPGTVGSPRRALDLPRNSKTSTVPPETALPAAGGTGTK